MGDAARLRSPHLSASTNNFGAGKLPASSSIGVSSLTLRLTSVLAQEKGLRSMDEYLFNHFIDGCTEVEEASSYLEILNYSVSGRPRDPTRSSATGQLRAWRRLA